MAIHFNHDEPPLIPPHTIVPEITLKAVILGIILAIILGASNAYLALKVGTTVAASIPASVIALAVFRFFKQSNVLETNLVQTAASAGEALASSVTFIMPALLILGYWSGFKFWETASITILGGVLGVCFCVPLRRVLLEQSTLPFPEGTAVGNVLKATTEAGAQMLKLIQGGLVGGGIVLCQTGFQIVGGNLPMWFRAGNILAGITIGFDPTLIGAGYIIGMGAGLALFFAMLLGWILGVPLLCLFYGLPAGDTPYAQVMHLWSEKIRYIGVGTMIVGGIWTLVTLFKIMVRGVVLSFHSFKAMSSAHPISILRTESDIPLKYVLLGMVSVLILCFLLITYNQMQAHLPVSFHVIMLFSLMGTAAVFVLGFFSSLVCGYLVGLIGSTNTPLSGVMIINLLLMALFLFPILMDNMDMTLLVNQKTLIAMVIFILALIGTAAAITNDNIQDLKAGVMVGATPWKQQVMMLLGIFVSSLAIAPIMQLLFQAYGIGGVFPHGGMNPSQMLPSPQAALLASLAQSIIGHHLPQSMLIIGMGVGILCIFIDLYLKTKGKRLAILAVGLGIYLPPEIISPTVCGALIHFFASRQFSKKIAHLTEKEKKSQLKASYERGTLLACGLVAGSALMGVMIAIPFVLKGSSDALRLVSSEFKPIAQLLGVGVPVILGVWLFRITNIQRPS